MHVCAGVFGNTASEPTHSVQELMKELGKKTTENDMILYNHGSSEGVFTFVTVRIQDNSYKIQSLLQVLGMIDIPIIIVSELTPLIAEQLVAIDSYNFQNGIIVLDGIEKDQLDKIIKNTALSKFQLVDKNPTAIKEKLKEMQPKRTDSPVFCPIDTYFDVKSVGVVILGIMKSGKLKKFDKLLLEPLGKEIMIKGIQSQDKNFDETEHGMRVGLNLKGIEVEELKRGQVVCDKILKSNKFSLEFKKSPFYKGELKENTQVFFATGLQVSVATIQKIEGSKITLQAEHQIAYNSGDRFLLATTAEKLPRIIGGGIISAL